jgi:hypothetical protein
MSRSQFFTFHGLILLPCRFINFSMVSGLGISLPLSTNLQCKKSLHSKPFQIGKKTSAQNVCSMVSVRVRGFQCHSPCDGGKQCDHNLFFFMIQTWILSHWKCSPFFVGNTFAWQVSFLNYWRFDKGIKIGSLEHVFPKW